MAEHPAHSGHEYGGAWARSAALAAGDPDWMNATGGAEDDGRVRLDEAVCSNGDHIHKMRNGWMICYTAWCYWPMAERMSPMAERMSPMAERMSNRLEEES